MARPKMQPRSHTSGAGHKGHKADLVTIPKRCVRAAQRPNVLAIQKYPQVLTKTILGKHSLAQCRIRLTKPLQGLSYRCSLNIEKSSSVGKPPKRTSQHYLRRHTQHLPALQSISLSGILAVTLDDEGTVPITGSIKKKGA